MLPYSGPWCRRACGHGEHRYAAALPLGRLMAVALLELAAAARLLHWELICVFLREEQHYVVDLDLAGC
jgi:hypothetical protein